jgi:2-keto-4-pentenoate hydratase/2-oxohepta-3-ene-1,7-dioic acid hydratase in catechol pathway
LTSRLFRIEHEGTAHYALELDGIYRLIDGDVFEGLSPLKQGAEAAAKAGKEVKPARILCPVTPSKVVAIGLNYKDHAAEMNKPLPSEPLMFMKPSTAVIAPGEEIRNPPDDGEIHYEAELGVVMGKRASRVSADKAMEHVLGLTCLIDVTARAAAEGNSVHASEGIRHVRADRSVHRSRARPVGARCRGLAERGEKAGVEHAAADFHGAPDRRVRLERHDPASGRRDRHRNAVGRGSAQKR